MARRKLSDTPSGGKGSSGGFLGTLPGLCAVIGVLVIAVLIVGLFKTKIVGAFVKKVEAPKQNTVNREKLVKQYNDIFLSGLDFIEEFKFNGASKRFKLVAGAKPDNCPEKLRQAAQNAFDINERVKASIIQLIANRSQAGKVANFTKMSEIKTSKGVTIYGEALEKMVVTPFGLEVDIDEISAQKSDKKLYREEMLRLIAEDRKMYLKMGKESPELQLAETMACAGIFTDAMPLLDKLGENAEEISSAASGDLLANALDAGLWYRSVGWYLQKDNPLFKAVSKKKGAMSERAAQLLAIKDDPVIRKPEQKEIKLVETEQKVEAMAEAPKDLPTFLPVEKDTNDLPALDPAQAPAESEPAPMEEATNLGPEEKQIWETIQGFYSVASAGDSAYLKASAFTTDKLTNNSVYKRKTKGAIAGAPTIKVNGNKAVAEFAISIQGGGNKTNTLDLTKVKGKWKIIF